MATGGKPKSALTLAIADTIRRVPRGRVSTYGAIAKAAGFPWTARHVGRVLREMPGLPWQRILGSGGRLSVPGEFALEQRFLLESEGVKFRGRRVDLAEFEHRFNAPARKPALGAASKKRVKQVKGTRLRRKL